MNEQPNLTAIRQRAIAATPGPWRWWGNVDAHNMALVTSTRHRGIELVMDFRRSGMQGAQPQFWQPNGAHPAKDLAIYQVCPDAVSRDDPRVYRGDIVGLRHPDAEFIAHARQDVDDLLAYIEWLEQPRQTEEGRS